MTNVLSRTLHTALLASSMAGGLAHAAGGFDADTEGWTATGNTAGPVWLAAGGNPGGHVTLLDDNDGWGYFQAPASLLASVVVGGTLSFDLKHTEAEPGYPLLYSVRIALQGNGMTLITELTPPTLDWANYSVGFDLAGGWREHASLAGNYNPATPAPTAGEFAAELGALSGLFIAADYSNGTTLVGITVVTSLDNVTLVPEPGSWALMAAGLLAVAGVAARRRG